MVNIKFDYSDATRASADLRFAASRLPDAMRRGAQQAAEPIADAIRREAAWSSRIPGAISVTPIARGMAVSVDPQLAPEAAPLNNFDKPGTFTHPVWGNDWTVQQQARPFMATGARRGQAEADRRFAAALTQWERAAGFK